MSKQQQEFAARRVLVNWLEAASRSGASEAEATDLAGMGLPPAGVAVMKKAADVCRDFVDEGDSGRARQHAAEIAGLVASRYPGSVKAKAESPRDLARAILGA